MRGRCQHPTATSVKPWASAPIVREDIEPAASGADQKVLARIGGEVAREEKGRPHRHGVARRYPGAGSRAGTTLQTHQDRIVGRREGVRIAALERHQAAAIQGIAGHQIGSAVAIEAAEASGIPCAPSRSKLPSDSARRGSRPAGRIRLRGSGTASLDPRLGSSQWPSQTPPTRPGPASATLECERDSDRNRGNDRAGSQDPQDEAARRARQRPAGSGRWIRGRQRSSSRLRYREAERRSERPGHRRYWKSRIVVTTTRRRPRGANFIGNRIRLPAFVRNSRPHSA